MDLANVGLLYPKKIKEPKPKKGLQKRTPLKAKTKLKSHYEPVDKKLLEELFEMKGSFCFMGLCTNCGGMALATDPHHFPHKGPHSTPDKIKYMWPANRICHDYFHNHPLEEKELFKLIETEGWKVCWKVEESKLTG
jgi:hypothetical protein